MTTHKLNIVLFLALAVCMMVTLCACTSAEKEESDDTTEISATVKKDAKFDSCDLDVEDRKSVV